MNYIDKVFESVTRHSYDKEFCVGNMLPVIGLEDHIGEPMTTDDIIKMISSTDGNSCVYESFSRAGDITDKFYDSLFTEASVKTPDEMKSIVDKLNSKGYEVKYASPGHANTAFKNDVYNDHVINGKLTTTARVIFKNNELNVEPPDMWEFKVLDGCTGLYVKPYSYSEDSQGSPEEAFKSWQEAYLASLYKWASRRDNIDGTTTSNNINKNLNSTKSKLKLKWKK